jgi:hypothetical protein
MSRAYHWVAEAQKAMLTVIGDGLKQHLEAPQDLPPNMAMIQDRDDSRSKRSSAQAEDTQSA